MFRGGRTQSVKGCWLCGGGLALPTQEVGCVGVCHCVGFVCALPVGFWLSVEISWRMGPLEEQACSCPSLPAQSIEYIKCTFPATPLQWTWLWLVNFYLFHVVYKVICAPQPISLVLLINDDVFHNGYSLYTPSRQPEDASQMLTDPHTTNCNRGCNLRQSATDLRNYHTNKKSATSVYTTPVRHTPTTSPNTLCS